MLLSIWGISERDWHISEPEPRWFGRHGSVCTQQWSVRSVTVHRALAQVTMTTGSSCNAGAIQIHRF